MTAARIVLASVVVSTGLFTGLVLYIVGMFQPLLSQLSGREFTVVMDRFLPAARKNFLNYLFTLTSLLAPLVALFLLRDHTDTAMFWLTVAGWLGFFAGPILGSRFVAEPLYDVMLGWDADHPPADWLAARARYYRINAIRTTGALAALVLSWPPSASPPPSQRPGSARTDKSTTTDRE